MDIERGNLEILFQKIPYMYVTKKMILSIDAVLIIKLQKICICGMQRMYFRMLQMMKEETVIDICVNRCSGKRGKKEIFFF